MPILPFDRGARAGLALVTFSFASLASLAGPSTGLAESFQPRPVLRIDAIAFEAPPKVRLFVTDLDGNGHARPPSVPGQYQLLINGLPFEGAPRATTAREASEPIELTLVVQLGPSMQPVFQAIKDGLTEIVDRVSPSSKVRIIGFGEDVAIDQKPATPADARAVIKDLAIRPNALEMQLATAVKAALTAAPSPTPAPQAAPNAPFAPVIRIVAVFSDGTARDLNAERFAELGRYAAENGVRVHTVGFAPIDDIPLRTSLSVLSRKSRGTERPTKASDQFKDAMRALAEEIENERILEYDLPQLFTGQQYDFQLVAGDVASEPVAHIIPKHEFETPAEWRPYAVGAAVVLALAAVGFAIVSSQRKKRKRAQSILSQLQPAPAPSQMGKTMPGLRPRPAADNGPAGPTAKMPAPPTPAAPSPSPAGAGPTSTQPMSTPWAGTPSPLTQSGPQSGPPPPAPTPAWSPAPPAPTWSPAPPAPTPTSDTARNPFGALPRLTQFKQMVDSGPPPMSSVPPTIEIPPRPAPVPTVAPSLPPAAPASPAPAPAPPAAPRFEPPRSPAPAAEAPRAPMFNALGPKFVSRKTSVLSTNELEAVDVSGWIVALPEGGPPVALRDGLRISSRPGADISVPAGSARPAEASFTLELGGRWSLIADGQKRMLEDGDAFEVGGKRFVYKFAARFPMEPAEQAPHLVVIGGLDDGKRIRLTDDTPRVVGSDESADSVVRGSGVARRHAAVRAIQGVCEIADLGSDIGIRAHGQAVAFARLEPGQEVQVGAVRLVFRVPSGPIPS